MTPDERAVRLCPAYQDHAHGNVDAMSKCCDACEPFAAVIREAVAAERAGWVALARQHCVRCCCEIVEAAGLGEVQPMVSGDSLEAAILAEREAIAAMIEQSDLHPEDWDIAAAIRARGKPCTE